MTLRARLVIGIVAMAAIGIFAVDIATYGLLRSFLLDRADEQLAGSKFFAESVATNEQNRPAPSQPNDLPPFRPGRNSQGSRRVIPPGSVAEIRDANGKVVRSFEFSVQETQGPRPRFPTHVSSSALGKLNGKNARPFTINAIGSSSLQYRTVAYQLPNNQTLFLAIPLRDINETLTHLFESELAVTLFVLICLGGLSYWFVRRGLRPLDHMGVTANAIAGGDLTQRIDVPNNAKRTEVGRLAIALNTMLNQIESSFTERVESEQRLQQFVADASHELRTPITAVRGYAELYRRGAIENPQELSNAMGKIEREASNMGDLVNSLLLLTQLEEHPPASSETCDLVPIIHDLVDALQVTDSDHPISIHAGKSAMVIGDTTQLRRVVSNLVANALEHTPAGTQIDVRVTDEADNTALEVEDGGSGIPETERTKIFDRFYRLDPSRSRQSGGAGLGLAIVMSIVTGLGGSAEVTEGAHGGALFRVRLPKPPQSSAAK